ncbi:hypothetical protein GYMLUDRAFT_48992 [Collybiopsis luxurians FD-317 M1]|uniref:Hydrophobin n=1 Tax=Collybiopsis luxurians FD-317 M1 TaxID=944289 RepID=A0A0D0BHD4_9AGAR|nr:hypothetical protein GYMLUDRAFT_48992 [Collybiopsis luxurians FD-317 M1]
MHFFTKILAFASVVSLTSASLLMERQCTSLGLPCDSTVPNECCGGLSCVTDVPGNSQTSFCQPTPGVCGTEGDQCAGSSCCTGLICPFPGATCI